MAYFIDVYVTGHARFQDQLDMARLNLFFLHAVGLTGIAWA